MSQKRHFFLRGLAVTAGIWCEFSAAVGHAASFTVMVDTTVLAAYGAPPAPFALEFQMIDGGGTVSNTATLSNFDFGAGGGPAGSPTTTSGASGDLSGTVTLTGSGFFNEFIQGFTPSGSSPLSFLLDLTENVESGTPDAFSLAIFDSSGFGIPTSFFDVFVQIDITSPLTINTYASDGSVSPPGCSSCAPINIPAPSVEPENVVPEPGILSLLVLSLVGLVLARRKVM